MTLWNNLQSLPDNYQEEFQQIYEDFQFPLELRYIFADWIESQNWILDEDDRTSGQQLLKTFLQMILGYRPAGNILEQTQFRRARNSFRGIYGNDSQLFVTNVRNMILQEVVLQTRSQLRLLDNLQALPGNYQEDLQQIYQDSQFPIELRHIFADWIETQNWQFDQNDSNHANHLLTTFLQMLDDYRPAGSLLEQTLFRRARDGFKATYEYNSQLFVTNVRNMVNQEIQLLIQCQSAPLDHPEVPNADQQNTTYIEAFQQHYENNKKLYKTAGLVGGVSVATLAAIPLGMSAVGFTAAALRSAGLLGASTTARSGIVATATAIASQLPYVYRNPSLTAGQSYFFGGATTGLFSALRSAGVLGASATAKAGIVATANAISSRLPFGNRNPPPAAAQSYFFSSATTSILSALQSAGATEVSATAKAGFVATANAISSRLPFGNRNPPPDESNSLPQKDENNTPLLPPDHTQLHPLQHDKKI